MSEAREPYNASNKKQVKEAEKKQKEQALQVTNDLKAVLELPEGRRVISRWLAQFKIAQLEWVAGAGINRDVAYYECANYILGQVIRVDPELGAKMLTEAYVAEINKREGVD